MKEACGPAHMKSILAIGELGSMENVYKVLLLQVISEFL
jgi:deoxyribose-phosphate aldolase